MGMTSEEKCPEMELVCCFVKGRAHPCEESIWTVAGEWMLSQGSRMGCFVQNVALESASVMALQFLCSSSVLLSV